VLRHISVDNKTGKGPLVLSVRQFEGLDGVWATLEVFEFGPGQVQSREIDYLLTDDGLIKFTAVEYVFASFLKHIQIEVSQNYLNVCAQFSLLLLIFRQQTHGRLQDVLSLRVLSTVGEIVAQSDAVDAEIFELVLARLQLTLQCFRAKLDSFLYVIGLGEYLGLVKVGLGQRTFDLFGVEV